MGMILETRGLDKAYSTAHAPAHQVLRGIDLQVRRGEFVSVMGPSGSGKSTLLYTASGMDRATGGDIVFAGTSLGQLSEAGLASLRLRSMGFVFQQSHLLQNMNLLDNIVLPGYQAGADSRSVVNSRAKELMRRTGIADLESRDITQVSGGQLQRAAICRALINRPRMLFADEPTGALHSSGSEEVMHIFADIHREGTAIMLITHDPKVAARSERVLYMRDGRLLRSVTLGPCPDDRDEIKQRERRLADWLTQLGY